MDASNKWRVPRHLDDPARILIFSLGEVIAIGAMFMIGLIIDWLTLCLFLCIPGIAGKRYAVKKLDIDAGPWAVVYWWTLLRIKPHMPASWQRFWRG